MMEWLVSMGRGESVVNTLVISPFAHTRDPDECHAAILGTFDRGTSKPRVAWYRENTKAFLDQALRAPMDWKNSGPGRNWG